MSSPPLSPAPIFTFGSHTDIGRRRAHNEDSHRCDQLGQGVLLTVCDGVGGAKAGEVASRMAVDGLQELLAARLARGNPPPHRSRWLDEAVRALDQKIRAAASDPQMTGMGATLSALWLEGWHAWWVQAGDSRIYRMRQGDLRQISQDQSPVGRMRADGELSEEEARSHPYRHVIDQCLGGGGPPVEPETGEGELEPGDVFLLCSDGLSDGLWDRDLARELTAVAAGRSPEVAARALVTQANDASGNDNITAVVARVDRPPSSASAKVKQAASTLLRTMRRRPSS